MVAGGWHKSKWAHTAMAVCLTMSKQYASAAAWLTDTQRWQHFELEMTGTVAASGHHEEGLSWAQVDVLMSGHWVSETGKGAMVCD